MKVTGFALINEIIGVFEKSKNFAENQIDQSSSVLMIIDKTGTVFRANKAAGCLFNCNFEHIAGKNMSELLNTAIHQDFTHKLSEALQHSENSRQFSIEFNNNKIFWFEVNPVLDSFCSLELYYLNAVDVTEFKKQIVASCSIN